MGATLTASPGCNCGGDVAIPRESVQTILVEDLVFDADPTGATAEFAFLGPEGTRPITSWTAGTLGPVVAETGAWRTSAETPQIGVGPLDLTVGFWRLFGRFTFSGDTIVVELGTIRIT